MHAAERERAILKLLEEREFISFNELNSRMDASEATIRRDLGRLEGLGRLVRVHGGARLVASAASVSDPSHLVGVPFHENIALRRAEKEAIGRAAATLCAPGESVIIDGGSTTLQMCPHLAPLGLQVLTNSLHIVSAILPQPNTRISLPAGAVFREQNIILSPFEDDGVSRYRASKMFLGAASVGKHGLMQTDVILVQAERRLLERADQAILLVDSGKFRAPAGHVVCELEDIDAVVTDDGIGSEDKRMLEEAGIRVIVARARTEDRTRSRKVV
ncbi:MAG TPA: DeoR/GlpR family DNA-binding transcription regulator [Alphaproteobacteria bacterium]|nr:DeoR/GlpR family DNA-binding transcription regulator [Alphaproteobacteria bacterium]